MILAPSKLSGPAPGATRVVLSLGAGVQSSTLALASARGDIPPVEAAYFADTGDEPARVYEYLNWLEAQLPYPVIRVKRPGPTLAQLAMEVATGERALSGSSIPPWYLSPGGMFGKQCSKEYKTRAVIAALRKHEGAEPRQKMRVGVLVEQWIGISRDELQRMKNSESPWIANRWPLIEAGMDRQACLRWMEERQYPRPPKSSCVYCPFRGNEAWADMKANAPDDFARACEVDEAIRPGWTGMQGEAWVHRSRKPLRTADFGRNIDQGDLFDGECEGMCGVWSADF